MGRVFKHKRPARASGKFWQQNVGAAGLRTRRAGTWEVRSPYRFSRTRFCFLFRPRWNVPVLGRTRLFRAGTVTVYSGVR